MYTKDVIKHFSPAEDDPRGAKKRITEVLNVTSGYISQWGEIVPEGQAYKLQVLTKGKLKVIPELYQKSQTA